MGPEGPQFPWKWLPQTGRLGQRHIPSWIIGKSFIFLNIEVSHSGTWTCNKSSKCVHLGNISNSISWPQDSSGWWQTRAVGNSSVHKSRFCWNSVCGEGRELKKERFLSSQEESWGFAIERWWETKPTRTQGFGRVAAGVLGEHVENTPAAWVRPVPLPDWRTHSAQILLQVSFYPAFLVLPWLLPVCERGVKSPKNSLDLEGEQPGPGKGDDPHLHLSN